MQRNRSGDRRNDETTGGATAMTVQISPSEVSALREAINAYMALDTSGHSCRILEDLYTLFASWERGATG